MKTVFHMFSSRLLGIFSKNPFKVKDSIFVRISQTLLMKTRDKHEMHDQQTININSTECKSTAFVGCDWNDQ